MTTEKKMHFTDKQLDQMRYEIAHPEYAEQKNRIIENCKKMFKEQGRDFDAEYQEFLKTGKTKDDF
jgi:hypothetical protein